MSSIIEGGKGWYYWESQNGSDDPSEELQPLDEEHPLSLKVGQNVGLKFLSQDPSQVQHLYYPQDLYSYGLPKVDAVVEPKETQTEIVLPTKGQLLFEGDGAVETHDQLHSVPQTKVCLTGHYTSFQLAGLSDLKITNVDWNNPMQPKLIEENQPKKGGV